MTNKADTTNNDIMAGSVGKNQEKRSHDTETSPKETSRQLKLILSLEIYRELSRQALLRGCTPEQLLALQIEELANASGRCAIP